MAFDATKRESMIKDRKVRMLSGSLHIGMSCTPATQTANFCNRPDTFYVGYTLAYDQKVMLQPNCQYYAFDNLAKIFL